MSQIQGIRNLKDLYSQKYHDPSGIGQYGQNAKKIKLPGFQQTKGKFMLNNSTVQSRKVSNQQKVKQNQPSSQMNSNVISQQNSLLVNSSREPKVVQLNLNQGNPSALISNSGSPNQSPRQQSMSKSQYGTGAGNRQSQQRRDYQSIFNHGLIKQNSNNLYKQDAKKRQDSTKVSKAHSRDNSTSSQNYNNVSSKRQQNSMHIKNASTSSQQHQYIINQDSHNSTQRNQQNSNNQRFQSMDQTYANHNQQQQEYQQQQNHYNQSQLVSTGQHFYKDTSQQQQQQQSFQQEQEKQMLIEKYKGSPFLNYVFNGYTPNGSQQQLQNNQNKSGTNFVQKNKSMQYSQQQQQKSFNQSNTSLAMNQSHMNNQSNNHGNTSNMNNTSQQSNNRAKSKENSRANSRDITGGSLANSNILNRNSFTFHYVIGKGGFGKVWKVELKKNKQSFAMKEMSKAKIITKRSINSVMSERHLLCQLRHPFLVNMNFAFQDRESLYLIMDLLNGGDLRFHVGKYRRFKEVQTRFFVACIVLALEYLHNQNILHRDIKPENLVLDNQGYVRITDLGIARIWKPENSQDTSGTPGYMAPEVMCRQNHGIAVDYFALGVMAYEFMMGRRPYLGRSRKEIRDQILAKQVQVKKHEIPEGWSIEAADFINQLIQRKPAKRLGVNGPSEVKNHPWLKNFPWQKLYNKQLEAPFTPNTIEDNFDYRQQISLDGRDTQEELIQQNGLLLRRNSVQNLFSGYSFDGQSRNYVGSTGSTTNTQNKTNDTVNNTLDKPYNNIQNSMNSNSSYIMNAQQKKQLAQQKLQQQQQQQQQLQQQYQNNFIPNSSTQRPKSSNQPSHRGFNDQSYNDQSPISRNGGQDPQNAENMYYAENQSFSPSFQQQ